MTKYLGYVKAGWSWYEALVARHPRVTAVALIVLALLCLR